MVLVPIPFLSPSIEIKMASEQFRRRFTIFVARLPWTVCRDTLKAHFQQYGKVLRSNVAFDFKTGRPKGYGFIEYGSLEEVTKALATDDHIIDGSRVYVQPQEGSSKGSTEV